MNRWNHRETSRDSAPGGLGTVFAELEHSLAGITDPRAAFVQFSRLIERCLDIRKGFLALREGDQTRFLAVAGWKKDGPPRSLSLRLPNVASFFEKVAEDGKLYSEEIAEFFDGNTIERRLLFDEDTVSFMLRPLKFDGRLVGLLGYSSDAPEAFVTAESGALDPAFERFATTLSGLRLEPTPAS